MANDISMLHAICQNTQRGCQSIKNVLKDTTDRGFRKILLSQMREYESIYSEAGRLLNEHGGEMKRQPIIARVGAELSAKMKVRSSLDPTAKIAELMLQGSTRGMVKSMYNIRTMGTLDPKVSSLSKRLLQTEQASIEEMKQYL